MSRLAFEKFKNLVEGLYHLPLVSWPAKLPAECLALLQSDSQARGISDDASIMQRAIESSIANQELASTREKYLGQPLAWEAGIDSETRLVPMVLPTISAQDFACWLAAQRVKPSEGISAWCAALGVKSCPEVSAANSNAAPATQSKPTSVRERNQLWAERYEFEKQVRVVGALSRAAKHFDVEPSKFRKSVQKILADRLEPADVSDNPGSMFRQLIKKSTR